MEEPIYKNVTIWYEERHGFKKSHSFMTNATIWDNGDYLIIDDGNRSIKIKRKSVVSITT